MVPLDRVAYFSWDEAAGKALRSMRGKTSRRNLAKIIKESGGKCSQQYVQKLEDGKAAAVEKSLLIALCAALQSDVSELMPIVIVPSQK